MSGLLTITLIAILGAISPGPDFVVVAKNAISHSRKAGVLSSLGIGVGMLFHATYCILGLGLIISQSLLLFSLVRYIGAAYLIYLGIKSLLSKHSHLQLPEGKSKTPVTAWKAFREGLLVNVLNPKCIMFMLSIFTIVIKPGTPYWVQTIYGFELAVITAAWFCFLAYLLNHAKVKNTLDKIQHVISKIMGGVLIFFGLDLILWRHK